MCFGGLYKVPIGVVVGMTYDSPSKPVKKATKEYRQDASEGDEETMTVEQYLLAKCSESVKELQQCAEKLNQELQVDAESCKEKIREIMRQIE